MNAIPSNSDLLWIIANHHTLQTKYDPEAVGMVLCKCKCETTWKRYKEAQLIKQCKFRDLWEKDHPGIELPATRETIEND